MGPLFTISRYGFQYFLTIVDDYTWSTWVYFVKSKSDTRPLLKAFFELVETQFQSKIKTIRTDNGYEFNMAYFAAKGTLHQVSCFERPHQNGIVERKQQHILNVVRALRYQATLPLTFWADCVLTSVYLINIIAKPILNHKSLYELLFSSQPSYSHLRVFGCYVLPLHCLKTDPSLILKHVNAFLLVILQD